MNERIRELAKQAGATLEKGYIELSDGQLMLSDNVELDKSNMDLEKFAELIVRECADLCKSEWDGDADTYLASEAYNECAEIIKEHFGVVE